ncbi:hypothetical protein OEA41_007493 [Lepraria neglecta]|uniref:Uncharacterized protein n=1 Tax=Lepraria neglecta TaxID=209136 RepID=A0AAD9ZFU3_9LECA|nr:hypothetical protein OEA41_007493 [Lepraria neglecta]
MNETTSQQPCDIVTEPESSKAKVASEDELTDTDTEIIELKEETNRLKEEMATLKDSKALHELDKELQAKVDILQQRDQRASRNRERLLLHALKVKQDDLRDHRSKQAFQSIVTVLREDKRAQDS